MDWKTFMDSIKNKQQTFLLLSSISFILGVILEALLPLYAQLFVVIAVIGIAYLLGIKLGLVK